MPWALLFHLTRKEAAGKTKRIPTKTMPQTKRIQPLGTIDTVRLEGIFSYSQICMTCHGTRTKTRLQLSPTDIFRRGIPVFEKIKNIDK